MRNLKLSVSRVLAALAGSLALSAAAPAATLLVPSQYPTIQAALNAAANGDEIRVAPGTYLERINLLGKQVRLLATGGSAATYISPGGVAGEIVRIASGETAATILEGFTILQSVSAPAVLITDASPIIRNCKFTQNQNNGSNGGVLRITGASTVLVDSCAFLNNRANGWEGGAIAAEGAGINLTCANSQFWANVSTGANGGAIYAPGIASLTLTGCAFSSNAVERDGAELYGGAVYVTGGTFTATNCQFTQNVVRRLGGWNSHGTFRGGALYMSVTQATASECVFSGNEVVSSDTNPYSAPGHHARGGAVFINGGSFASFTDCDFAANKVRYSLGQNVGGELTGGACHVSGANPIFLRCDFTNNSAVNVTSQTARGGALYHEANCAGRIESCTFSNNTASHYGGAVHLSGGSQPFILKSDFTSCSVDNEPGRGGAIHATGTAVSTLLDCRFTGCSAIRGGAIWSESSPLYLFACTIDHNTAVANEGSALRSNGTGLSYTPTLVQCMLCSNSGTTSDQWITGSINQPTPGSNYFVLDCGDDCNENGINDLSEVAALLLVDCNANMTPDICEIGTPAAPDCNGNLIPDSCDIAAGVALDCDHDTVPDSCQIAAGLGDCDEDGELDHCEIADGAEDDCNANGRPDTCDLLTGKFDCDGDGDIDTCEIAAGTELDCNQNQIPDDCELASGIADCNTNNIPDICDIASGLSDDADNDGVPDECGVIEFLGLYTEVVPIADRAAAGLPQTAQCFRIWATFATETAGLWAVYGNALHPLTISAPGGFFQSPNGSNTTAIVMCNPPPGFDAGLGQDTWLTIDRTCAASNLLQFIGIDWSGWDDGTLLSVSNGALFVLPGSPQGYAGADKKVLIAQVTTLTGALPTGLLCLLGSNSDESDWIARSIGWPAPLMIDCNDNGKHDAYDIADGTSNDCDNDGVPDECSAPGPGASDCNNNGIADRCDIDSGTSFDTDGDGIPDECECMGDVDGNGSVDVDDLIEILISWGESEPNPADLNEDLVVDSKDLLLVLVAWGQCL